MRTTVTKYDGKIMIAENFVSVGGKTCNRVARLHAEGALDTTFIPNAGDAVSFNNYPER